MKYILDLDKTIIASIEESNQALKEGNISKMVGIYKEVIPLAATGIAETNFKNGLIENNDIETHKSFFIMFLKGKGPDFLKDFVTGGPEVEEVRNNFFTLWNEYKESSQNIDNFFEQREQKNKFELIRKKANQFDVPSIYELADAYYRGEGVEKNYVKAETFFKMAASMGDFFAQVQFGYFKGKINISYLASYFWLSVAINNPKSEGKSLEGAIRVRDVVLEALTESNKLVELEKVKSSVKKFRTLSKEEVIKNQTNKTFFDEYWKSFDYDY